MSTAQPISADSASAGDGAQLDGDDDQLVEAPEVDDSGPGFKVRLSNFTGPFDLLLQLIGKHKLDVTEVALHTVTDEFIAYIRAMGDDWDLDEVSEFLVIASTLLDLKAARLLPSGSVEDEEDLALLEARDLLFARLLQYKAFKEAAAHISGLEGSGARRWPRVVVLEPQFAKALPELVLGIGPERLRDLALKAMQPKIIPTVGISHIHMERVSVREHAAIIRDGLIRMRTGTFRALCSDCQSTLEVVARFLALLELYREGLVAFEQIEPLGELTVRWTGPDTSVELDVDEYAGLPVSTPDVDAPDTAVQMGAVIPADPAAAAEAAVATHLASPPDWGEPVDDAVEPVGDADVTVAANPFDEAQVTGGVARNDEAALIDGADPAGEPYSEDAPALGESPIGDSDIGNVKIIETREDLG